MYRIGQGIDFHLFEEGRRMILGGVDLGLDYGLKGHSDADVLTHALMDAILGALSLGDIGEHFPDTDQKYLGIDSMKLLDHVLHLMKEKGYEIENADITLVGQKPKVSLFKERIKASLEQVLKCDVNIKATTTEGLGDIGKGEGLACSAVVLLKHGTL
ncbi:2-C-methyl-D-erythritol 2,4-cyclodiphosphate synthase [Guggenheimella bovis]